MTSNERKILKCLWDAKGRAYVRVVSENIGITADYTRLLCRSLARAGYLKFADASVCYLLTRGRNRFQKNDELAPEEPSKAPQSEPQEIDKTEARAENPIPTAPLESHEKAVPKEESAKPIGGFGASFKKIVNWFAEKK